MDGFMMFGFGLNTKKWVKESQKTEKETKKNSRSDYNTWKKIKKIFSKDLEAFEQEHLENQSKIVGSLVYSEMVSFTKRFSIVESLANWGYYHSSLHELRFLLDTTILAFYLDLQLPNTDQASKIKLMQKHKGELWGTRLRRRAFIYEEEFGAEIEKVIQDVNNSIDQYLADNLVDSWKLVNLPYIETEYKECIRNTKNVVAFMMRIFTKRFERFEHSGDMTITHIEEDKIESLQI